MSNQCLISPNKKICFGFGDTNAQFDIFAWGGENKAPATLTDSEFSPILSNPHTFISTATEIF